VFDAALAAQLAGPDLTSEETFAAWQRATAPTCYAAWTPAAREHARDQEFGLAAVKAFFSVDPPADFADRLAAVRAPVRIIGGAQDSSTGVAPVVALAELLPAGETVLLDACGHYPWVEQPDLFRQVAEEFLDSV